MSRFSVKKPMTVFVAVIIVIALGIVSLIKMTPDLLPSIDLPYVVVMTTYPGATPEEVEQTVSKPLEQNLATVENLKSVQSVSNANYSLVVLEFENDADMNTAIVNTMQGVDLVEGSWDEEIGSPYIMKINPNMMPITIAAVDKKGATTEEVSTFVEDELMNQLEGITGVASISTGGLIESKVNVSINEDKIEKLTRNYSVRPARILGECQGKAKQRSCADQKWRWRSSPRAAKHWSRQKTIHMISWRRPAHSLMSRWQGPARWKRRSRP